MQAVVPLHIVFSTYDDSDPPVVFSGADVLNFVTVCKRDVVAVNELTLPRAVEDWATAVEPPLKQRVVPETTVLASTTQEATTIGTLRLFWASRHCSGEIPTVCDTGRTISGGCGSPYTYAEVTNVVDTRRLVGRDATIVCSPLWSQASRRYFLFNILWSVCCGGLSGTLYISATRALPVLTTKTT